MWEFDEVVWRQLEHDSPRLGRLGGRHFGVCVAASMAGGVAVSLVGDGAVLEVELVWRWAVKGFIVSVRSALLGGWVGPRVTATFVEAVG